MSHVFTISSNNWHVCVSFLSDITVGSADLQGGGGATLLSGTRQTWRHESNRCWSRYLPAGHLPAGHLTAAALTLLALGGRWGITSERRKGGPWWWVVPWLPLASSLRSNESKQPFHCSLTLIDDTPSSLHRYLNERGHEGSVGVVMATGQLKV